MSKIVDFLRKYAQEEKVAHEEYIKDFSASTISHLVQGGVERDKANFIAKEACLRDETLMQSVNRAMILEKTADYIDALENDIAKLQVKISESPAQVEKQAETPEHFKHLANIGFTPEEIEALKNVPESVIEKVAATASEPHEMGRGVGPAVPVMDPFLEFILK